MASEPRPDGETRSLFEREHWPATNQGLRYRVYRMIFHHDRPVERNFDLWLIVAILASVLVVMLDSVEPVKARYFEDKRFTERVLPPPDPTKTSRTTRKDAWTELKPQAPDAALLAEIQKAEQDAANSGLRREPELPDHVAIVKETTDPNPADEFKAFLDDEPEDAARQRQALRRQMSGIARQVAMDPNDNMDL